MDMTLIAGLTLGALVFGMLALGMWVSVTLLVSGIAMMALFTPAPVGSLIASTVWDSSWGWALTSLPLFVWMGEILFRSNLSRDLFRGLAPWVAPLPGGLLHVNVLGCAVMAAITGSSAVTCATIGRLSVPELEKRGYPIQQTIGTLAGSGTMGLLIPPSIIMIVYGVSSGQSIARLFMAGVIPGLVLVLLYMGYVGLRSLVRPDEMPRRDPPTSLAKKLLALRNLAPSITLVIAVIGSIYGGYATPTEAAAIGVCGSLLLSMLYRTLDLQGFMDGLLATVRTSCMIAFIIAAASCLTIAVAFIDLPRQLAEWVGTLGLPPMAQLAVIALLILVLGCFLEGISIIVLTSSVMLPMVQAAGIDLIWFGIFLVILIEAAQITPPVGFNLFVLQNLTGKDILFIARATLPYFLLLIVLLILITLFPVIVLGLTQVMG
ncbi:TRAP transporter large permease subunit [Paracoccus sp. R12_1]|uniref:TRAP transporter large permease n=1 Tax=unclassified Paracoccus (in: a-proteobacteria) TaxID=2688777 RepID=UPI001ADBE493|nr:MULTISPECIES: TRAP transporter large permease subunit [unclassified Paracoccus (in: a-proteobacteria)]MBO9457000.1 TRAP transporter large permease subunit [Paracoccus sp. R12_2]MBO9488115.1 TRAP transporter large permease subunit [Paracoccus sp. R12_1]